MTTTISAAAIAEHLARRGVEVTYVTSGGKVAEWSDSRPSSRAPMRGCWNSA